MDIETIEKKPPGINLKDIPGGVYDLILDKQNAETKKRKQKVNLSICVIMLLKEAYLQGDKRQ